MKLILLLGLFLGTSFIASGQQTTQYVCPMHQEVISAKPGTCPKCGMDLEPRKIKQPKPKKTAPEHEHQVPPSKVDTVQRTNAVAPNHQEMQHNEVQEPPIERKEVIEVADQYLISEKPRTIRYDLYVTDTVVNFTGKPKRAIAVNGQIPMPTLTFTEGDTAEIYVHNRLDEETSMHWHGLFLPNQYDGVPNLTQMPIKPHTTHLYKFPIIQSGTHWYHSHTDLQEQIGMYGMFIMNKKQEPAMHTIPIVISEWTDMNPKEVHRSLHNATDWFAIQKRSTQSYAEAIRQGYFKTKVGNEWKRMTAMDVSDVYYDKILINGKSESQLPQFQSGDKVRLRIANGGASDYFWLTYSGGKITVVANDGNDVEPVEVDRLIIAVSETYDVIVNLPDSMRYEFLVTTEDRTNSASLWLGNGMKMPAPRLPKLKYFEGMKMMNGMMKMNGELDDMGMQMSLNQMDMNVVMYPEITGELKTKNKSDESSAHDMHKMEMDRMQTDSMYEDSDMDHRRMDTNEYDANALSDIVTLNYAMLKSTKVSSLPSDAPVREIHFQLSGNMSRYVWSIDNKVVSEADKILIHKGENVRIIVFNGSMMRHPMHLHGHDFRLLNGHGDYAPLKNIVDIMPMETDTLEFNANVYGDWFFHCHILYHMMSGMGRVFTYENQPSNPEIPDPKLAQRHLFADDKQFHFMARIGIETNGSDGEAMLANTRWKLSTLWHMGYHAEHGYESETMFGRYLGKMQWLQVYGGFDYHYKAEGDAPNNFFSLEGSPKNIFGSEDINMFGQSSNKNNRKAAIVGITYVLPMLFVADARIDTDGKFRIQLGREDLPITNRLRFNIMINTDKEYMAGFRFITSKYLSLSSHYDSDMGPGVGVTFTY